ncbi:MAG: hypothetical protein R3C05_16205 [Pirellulaceae bacterium]
MYDQQTGRLAITNDDKGILFYDLAKVLKADAVPIAIVSTESLPVGICNKTIEGRRVLVVATKDSPQLQLIDADSMKPTSNVPLQGIGCVDFIAGSANGNDPFVYVKTCSVSKFSDEVSKERTKAILEADKVWRINLQTGEQSGPTQSSVGDLIASDDGETIYARVEGNDGVAGNWSQLLGYNGSDRNNKTVMKWPRNYANEPIRMLNGMVALRGMLYTTPMDVKAATLDFSPGAGFKRLPYIFGLDHERWVMSSVNGYHQVAEIPLPVDWFGQKGWFPEPDFRTRQNVTPYARTTYLDFFADDARKLAITIMSDKLLIVSLDALELQTEPNLADRKPLPSTVAVGEPIELELGLRDGGAPVEFEYIASTESLPDETQRLLTAHPQGEAPPRPLQLQVDAFKGQRFFVPKHTDSLSYLAKKLPFNILVNDTKLAVVNIAQGKWILSKPLNGHIGTLDRIAILDDQDRDITSEIASACKPPAGLRLALAAAISPSQEIVFVGDARKIEGVTLPTPIQIGDERMMMTGVDRIRHALSVTRTEPAEHSVTSPCIVLAEAPNQDIVSDAITSNLPTLNGNRLQWTPNSSQIGTQNIRMRTHLGELSHEWFWRVTVKRFSPDIPFAVTGMEPDLASNRAVVWGQSMLFDENRFIRVGDHEVKFYLGTYDMLAKELIHHVEVPKPIAFAVIAADNVYASLIENDIVPKSNAVEERARRDALRKEQPSKLIRFDAGTLQAVKEVEISNHCVAMKAIGGRYLSARIDFSGKNLRFSIPDLTLEPPIPMDTSYPIAGRLRDGWVWDGIIWDLQMRKPRLLLFPAHFLPTAAQISHGMRAITSEPHVITNGCFAINVKKHSTNLPGAYALVGFPAGLGDAVGELTVFDWTIDPTRNVENKWRPARHRIIGWNTFNYNSNFSFQEGKFADVDHVSESDGFVHIVLDGKLFSIAIEELRPSQQVFHFEERQSQMELDLRKTNTLEYFAPGAKQFRLSIWNSTSALNQPRIVADSTDGTFRLTTQQMKSLFESGPPSPAFPRESELAKNAATKFKELTGRNARGDVLPVRAKVEATHDDGLQQTELWHYFLIDVPTRP